MAYGSSSALLSVLDQLDADVTALVRDVTGELLGRDPAVGRVIHVDVKDTGAVADVLGSLDVDAALVVSNLTNVQLYRSRGLPVFFVDILYWYSEQKRHAVWDVATRAYVQAFPGVAERVRTEAHARPPTVVGPLIRALPPPASPPNGALVNLGGVRSRFIGAEASASFLSLVCDVLASVRSKLPRGPVTVAAGGDAVEWITRRGAPDLEPRSLPQAEYLRRLVGAEILVTAPGLNAVFEGLECDRPLVFLPPQNATQVLQLAWYERLGLVRPGLNLTELVPSLPRVERVGDEEAYTRVVLGALDALVSSSAQRAAVAAHVGQQVDAARAPDVVAARREFRDSLGPRGGPIIARDLRAWWESR